MLENWDLILLKKKIESIVTFLYKICKPKLYKKIVCILWLPFAIKSLWLFLVFVAAIYFILVEENDGQIKAVIQKIYCSVKFF